MASIEKRVRIKVIMKEELRPDLVRMIELGIGIKIPVPWIEKGQNKPTLRSLPIVEIDMCDKDNPEFILDASTKYNSKLIRHSFNTILEYCFDSLNIPGDINYIRYNFINNIKITEYVSIINGDGYESLLDDIVKVTDCNMISCTGRLSEIDIDSETFTIDNSEDGKSSIRVYSINKVFSIYTTCG